MTWSASAPEILATSANSSLLEKHAADVEAATRTLLEG